MGIGSVKCDDGVRLVYETDGEGPVMVFVAGLGDDRRSWANQVAHFSTDHTVITFDNRGCGESDLPPGPYSIARLAADAHCVVEALGLTGITAVGSSMGGAICQRWALDHPADIERLVITNSWGERDTFTDALFDHWISLADSGQGRVCSAKLASVLLLARLPDASSRDRYGISLIASTESAGIRGGCTCLPEPRHIGGRRSDRPAHPGHRGYIRYSDQADIVRTTCRAAAESDAAEFADRTYGVLGDAGRIQCVGQGLRNIAPLASVDVN